jgi:phosphoglycolate phosphatase-like HAD superfamily hydrolase
MVYFLEQVMSNLMMNTLRAVLFDVDGVLLDSLGAHLRMCEDKNREYGLGLTIPTPLEFRGIVRSGTRISPMKYFFIAVGFPEGFAIKADIQYQAVFMKAYRPAPYPGVHRVLGLLNECGLQMGIVTSNVQANVLEALDGTVDFFRRDCIFTKDNFCASKSEAIVSAISKLRIAPQEIVYVGDQPADREAAKAAGVGFLGAAYGWGISATDTESPIVENVQQMYSYIAERAHCAVGR